VFELCPLHGDVSGLHAGGIELRLRLGDLGLGSSPAFEAVHCELQRIGIGLHRIIQQLLLCIGAPQREIVPCQLRLQAELDGLEISGSRLGLCTRRCHRPPDAAPEVQLVGKVEGEEKVPAAATTRERSIGGLAYRTDADPRLDGREL
jgi:hypothetical protein